MHSVSHWPIPGTGGFLMAGLDQLLKLPLRHAEEA